jgi:peptidoglycan/LPS O-acetylase OafA/YrhL
MGIIRLLLAISVVIDHSNPLFGFIFVGGQLAVEVFFIISGFYMALILCEKYNQTSNRKIFIGNRLLKILPTYWVILFLGLIYELANAYFHSSPNEVSLFVHPGIHLNLFSFLYFLLTNIIILGQDIILYLGINIHTGVLFLTSDFRLFSPPLYSFMILPQAWSLSLELTFYFLVPFIIKFKTKWLLLIMSLSLILRIILYHFGLDHDPWTYRFFPTELVFFLSGIIAYRAFKFIENKNIKKWLLYLFYGSYLSLIIFYQYIPDNDIKMWSLLLATIVLLPFIFRLTKNIKIDKIIGELSYPVYISHFLVIDFLTHFTSVDHSLLSLIASIISILLSIMLFQFIMKPIDKIRQNRIIISHN